MTQEFIKAFNEANKSASGEHATGFRAGMRRKFTMFRRDEDGSLIIFGLYMLVCMMIISGLAVDTMRAEYQRTKIQYTTDRALLAAASIKQSVPAQDIFDDYFAKAGMKGMAPTATVIKEDNYRRVSAKYAPDDIPTIDTIFMSESFRDLLETRNGPEAGGVNQLSTYASGVAVDGVDKVEISLVLDVSGSMGGQSASGDTKLNDLKGAANEFIDTLLLDQPEEDTYSISIVPYSNQVNVGENLLSKYGITNEHNYSNCADFQAADFTTTEINPADPLQRTGHFHSWNNPYKNKDNPFDNDDNNIAWQNRACPTIASRAILPLSGDIDELKDYIDAFQASGNTSTELGIKWGAALLDPTAQDVVAALVSDGDVDAKFSDRPYVYNATNSLKVIVVMTDGANTYQELLAPEVSSGLSNVWYRKETTTDWRGRQRTYDRYAIYNQNHWGSKDYYHPDIESRSYGTWKSAPDNGDFVQLTYPQLYKHASVRYVASYLMDPAGYNYNYWRYGVYSRVGPSSKDPRMDAICTAAKNNGTLIFTIGFEVTDSNAAKLSHCATTAGHFFRVDGVEISEAFASIAAQLHRLRLEQ